MTFRVLALALLLSLLLAACGPTRETLELDTQKVPASRLIALVQHRGVPDITLTGDGSIAFDSPRMSGSAFFSVAPRRADSVRVSLEGPFGLDVGFLYADRSHLVFYNAMENWYIDEPAGSPAIQKALPFDLSFGQLIEAFTGTFRLPASGSPVRYTIDDDRFLMTFVQDSDTASYWIDPALSVVTRYRVSRDNAVLIEGTAERWTDEGGELLPQSIAITFPPASSSVSVVYTSMTVNPDMPSFSHAIPSKARRRLLQ
jgi:outer membrane biogenesis lipoprotein LolB